MPVSVSALLKIARWQLSNVEFTIPAGSFVGVVGSSGSGKSTLLKLLTRLYEPSEGVIRIDGHDISKVDLYSLRAQSVWCRKTACCLTAVFTPTLR